jgi:flagellar assembly protein FliH
MERFDDPDYCDKDDHCTFEDIHTADSDAASFQLLSFGERHKPIDEARKKAALIEREAYEKGFAQGEKDGFEIGSKKVDKILDQISKTLEEIASYRREFIKLHEKEILHLICRVAEKVINGGVKVDHTVVRQAIFEAFDLAADCTNVTVRVSPEDVEYVKEVRPEFFDQFKDLKSLTVESDPSICSGGCLMETAFGQVDARLETQLNNITKAVERAYEEASQCPSTNESLDNGD